MITSEVRSEVARIESAISKSAAGGPVLAVELLVASAGCLILLLDGVCVGFRGIPVSIALVSIGVALVAIGVALRITLVAIGIALSIVGPRIVCARLTLPRC